jgi:DNA modification methylase
MDFANTLTIRRVPLGDLHLDPANARSHNERNLDAIRASLARFGQAEPLVVQKRSGRVVGGNGRLVAMRALGWTHADVVEVDLDDLNATALSIALNRTGELADWDLPTLGRLLESLRAEDALDGVGYELPEVQEILDGLLAGLSSDVVQDEAPGLPDAATTQRGDTWILGPHRVECGDSSSPEDLDQLLAGAPVHLLNTDPPYNVRVEPRSNNAIAAGLSSFTGTTHHQGLDVARHPGKAKRTHDKLRPKDRPLENDFLPEADFALLLRKWFGNASRVLLPGRGFYVWGGYGNLGCYPPALAESGLYFSQGIVWDKGHPVLTRKDFMGAYEIAFYGWKEGAAHEYFGPNNALDLWPIKKVNPQSMVHLTEKPVELAARAIQYSSRPGENVLDLFGGSGSTLIGCEQTGRNAYLMEIDTLYTDVIVSRWEKFTGKDAVLEGTGQTFKALCEERHTQQEASS